MSKILLIKPCWPYPYSHGEHTYNRIWAPLSLVNCASLLRNQGHEVKIIDMHALRIGPEGVRKYLNGADMVFLTSSSLDRWQCPNIDIEPFFRAARSIRLWVDEFYVLGYHGTVDPVRILEETRANAVIRGGPEGIVAEICSGKSLKEIDGVSYFENGRVVSNQDAQDFDLRMMPIPAYDLLDIHKYYYEILGKDFLLFEMARGCNYTCRFCNKIMYGKCLKVKTAPQVFEELRFAVEQLKVKTGYFMDLEFLAREGLANEVCDFLISKKYDFRWCCQTRADYLNGKVLKKMKSAGCQLIHIGVESGVQDFLDLAGKNTTAQKLRDGVMMCQESRIETLAFYVFGFDGETAEDRAVTFDFAKELQTDYASFHKLFSYDKGDIYMPALQSNKEIDADIRGMYLKYYLHPACFRMRRFRMPVRSLTLFLGRLMSLA